MKIENQEDKFFICKKCDSKEAQEVFSTDVYIICKACEKKHFQSRIVFRMAIFITLYFLMMNS